MARPTAAELDAPTGIAVDSAGDIFIADSGNDVIREVLHSSNTMVTVAGNGTCGFGGDGGGRGRCRAELIPSPSPSTARGRCFSSPTAATTSSARRTSTSLRL